MAKTVLLVEDDVLLSRMYQDGFEDEGLSVILAFNGQEALDILNRGQKPDVILLDLLMPVMDGLTALSEMSKKKLIKNIPVIVLTNVENHTEEIDKAKNMGAKDYIVKRLVHPRDVVKKVLEFLQ